MTHRHNGNDALAPDSPDLVVVGAGVAGMTAALVGALEGLRVILCEATQQVGGTSATSAGTLWIPGNRHGAGPDMSDAVKSAGRYLDAAVGPDDPRGLRRAFLDCAAAAVDDLERRTSVAFVSSGKHPDYLQEEGAAIEGRAVSPVPFDGRLLGADFARIRPPLPEFLLLGGMMVGKADIQSLVNRWRSWRAFEASARLVARYAIDRLSYPRGTRLVMGNALVARLFLSLRNAGVDIRYGWQLKRLDAQGGRVHGGWFATPDGMRLLTAQRGVVLAAGGIGHAPKLREKWLGTAKDIPSLTCESVAAEGLCAAQALGAGFETHERGNFFWQPVSVVRRGGSGPSLFPHLFLDRAKPGLIAVDQTGRRFVNEAVSYHHFVEGMLAAGGADRRRTWLICDAGFVRRYGLGVIPPGTRRLRAWAVRGYIHMATTVEALARAIQVDPAMLKATIERSNSFAVTGTDVDFRRGQTELDRFNGDAAHLPNPCLGTIAEKPFCALEILPADAASSAGVVTDADGVVQDQEGRAMPGLYACGNDAASLMRGSYPGPGITLGPAMVFAWRIGLHAARFLPEAQRTTGRRGTAHAQGTE